MVLKEAKRCFYFLLSRRKDWRTIIVEGGASQPAFEGPNSSVQSLSRVRLFATPWTAARQASLSITNSRVYSNSCPLSRWCHPTISSSVILFSSCPQSFPASGSLDPVYSTDRWLERGVSGWSNTGLFTRYECVDFVMRVWMVLTENTECHTGFQRWGWGERCSGEHFTAFRSTQRLLTCTRVLCL